MTARNGRAQRKYQRCTTGLSTISAPVTAATARTACARSPVVHVSATRTAKPSATTCASARTRSRKVSGARPAPSQPATRSRKPPSTVGIDSGTFTEPGTPRACTHPTPRPASRPGPTRTAQDTAPTCTSRRTRCPREAAAGRATSAIPMHTSPPGSLTAAARPPSAAPHTQPRSTVTTSAAAISPTISRSLWRPPTPWASISGEQSTTDDASAGSTPAHAASLGTAQASRASPSSATRRCATTSSHGLPVTPATASPNSSGTGPYGAAVSIQRGSTPCTIGPTSTPGPNSYGEMPTCASTPWAAYDQPSREKSGGASTSGADHTTVACRTSAIASSRSRPSARATSRHRRSHAAAWRPRPSSTTDSPAIRPASEPRSACSTVTCISAVDAGRVEMTMPPRRTSRLPANPRVTMRGG
ncbi:hypothetical protein C7S10_02470 [Nocardioides currus]|uniref:Uncharacterized protein n=1 Tax=Nocardioides currus TaxID=2133958 RepID=A0A2R7Z2Z8_9ACTN|nr:hypothetical protein C7S10_02470 [Nocardioides currus]